MRVRVVFESMSGNTARVAEAIGEGLGGVPISDVSQVQPNDLSGAELLVHRSADSRVLHESSAHASRSSWTARGCW